MRRLSRFRLSTASCRSGGRFGDFADRFDGLSFAEDTESVREVAVETRRMVVARDPERAQEQRQRRRRELDELIGFGDRLAAKLAAQNQGKKGTGPARQ